MAYEMRADRVDKEKPRESKKPSDLVRGRTLKRTFEEVSPPPEEVSLTSFGDSRPSSAASRTSAEGSRTSAEGSRVSSIDSLISSRDGSLSPEERRRDGGLFSRDTSPVSEERLNRLVQDKRIIPENLFSSKDKAGDGKKTEKSFARSAWDKVKKFVTSQNTMMGVMFVDDAINNISQKFSKVEGELLHAGGGGGNEGGGMPPIFPNSDSDKEEESDKTPEKTTKGRKGGGVSAPGSELRPEGHAESGKPKGRTGEQLKHGAYEALKKQEVSHSPEPPHKDRYMSGGLGQEIEYV